MRKGRYYIANFSSCSLKCSLATLLRSVLQSTGQIFKIFQMYDDESYVQSPRRILHNLMQNTETIFGLEVSHVNNSREEQSSQELSSPAKAESSSRLPKKELPFVDKTKEASEHSNIETKTAADGQKSEKSCTEAETFSRSVGDDPFFIYTTKELEVKLNPKEPEVKEKSPEKYIKDLLGDNLAQIKSMSIIRQSEEIGVEIDIYLLRKSDENLLEELEQDSNSTGKTNSPGRAERKSNSPSSSTSKQFGRPSILNESSPTVDYSDPSILEFLAERLLSILCNRKRHMNQIYNCFTKFKKDITVFSNTIMNLKFVVERLPIVKEKYFSRDTINLRGSLINEAEKMLVKVELLKNDVDKDIAVWEECIQQINNFDRDYGLLLSVNCEPILNFSELKRLESSIKEICAQADGTVILKDGRREILLKSLPDFGCLIKNFVKFLIITEMLKPPLIIASEVVKEK